MSVLDPLAEEAGAGGNAGSSGRRPSTPAWKRVARVAVGTLLIVAGLVMLVTPGPGLLALAMGLFLLAPDFPPARRIVNSVLRRWPKIRRHIPRKWRDHSKKGTRAK